MVRIPASELSKLHNNLQVTLDEEESKNEVFQEWQKHVNMTASELEEWSNNPCSREASVDPEKVIKRNLRLLEKDKEDWTEEDVKDAKRTINFISRMNTEEMKPDKPKEGPHGCPSEWAISLLNWAFNPFESIPDIPDDDDLEDVDKITMSNEEEVSVDQGKIQKPEDGEAKEVFDSKKIKEAMDKGSSDSSDSMQLYPTDFSVENRQEVEQEGEDFFRSNWQGLFREENRAFSYQMHWMGLNKEQKEMSHGELLDESDVRAHGDLRLEIDSSNGFGFTVFEDEDEIDIQDESVFVEASKEKQPNEDRIEGVWKERFPEMWIDFGFEKPLVFEPGETGATEDTFGKVFGIERGTWTPGVVHKNSAEIFLEGDKIDARAIISFVPLPNGNDTWVVSFPENQTPEAERTTLDTKVQQLKKSSTDHSNLIWNNPNDDEPPRNVNINRFELSEDKVEEITVEEMNALFN